MHNFRMCLWHIGKEIPKNGVPFALSTSLVLLSEKKERRRRRNRGGKELVKLLVESTDTVCTDYVIADYSKQTPC